MTERRVVKKMRQWHHWVLVSRFGEWLGAVVLVLTIANCVRGDPDGGRKAWKTLRLMLGVIGDRFYHILILRRWD